MELSAESVLALAPDAAAVWGECQGSGSKPYQTQVDLSGPTFKCSCPSRKFPCKHGLALLLLRAKDASPAALKSAQQRWTRLTSGRSST